MKKLSRQSFAAARLWLDKNGRPLEQVLCAMFFDNGPSDAVVEALSMFQNTDGGYGHCLEPDHTNNASTVLNTSAALAIHCRINTPSTHPQITKAKSYLESCFDRDHKVWPIRFPIGPGTEGPPWFAAESLEALMANFGGCRVNPTAEIIGYLYNYSDTGVADWLDQARDHLMQWLLDPNVSLSQHELMCTAHLLQSPALPDDLHQRLLERIQAALPMEIESDIGKWGGYAFRPTIVIDEPEHLLADCISQELLFADLDFEIDRISDDGAWHPYWDWGEPTSSAWQEAECAWSSILTERTLRVLANFGRICD
ncbi:hypothetical protein [Poriferisphaera sp. WC338]|uniref:hypothetical protein n=1 Tax=Poriferisphaera sp. WC338 TaxID=3425129 RepID=UPI003D81BB59